MRGRPGPPLPPCAGAGEEGPMTRLLGLLAVVGLLVACGSAAAGPPATGSAPAAGSGAATAPAAARALPPEIAALVDAARREGRVVVYGTNSTPAEEETIQRAFAD